MTPDEVTARAGVGVDVRAAPIRRRDDRRLRRRRHGVRRRAPAVHQAAAAHGTRRASRCSTAGRAAMQLPGADPESPLGRGLAKLAAALGETDDPSLVVELASTPLVDEFVPPRKPVERVRMRYWTASRDEVTERELTPRRVFHERGDWFVAGDDQPHRVRTARSAPTASSSSTGQARSCTTPAAPTRSPAPAAARSRWSLGWFGAPGHAALAPGRPVGPRAVPRRPRHRARRWRRRRGDGGDQRAVAGAVVVRGHRRRGARPGGMARSRRAGRAVCFRPRYATPPA